MENYLSAGESLRNISQIEKHQILDTVGLFRIVELPAPYVEGSKFWVVNEKGFLWEPARTVEAAREYLKTTEAVEYCSTAWAGAK